MSSVTSPRRDWLSDPSQDHGLQLAGARPSCPGREAHERRGAPSSLSPLSISDWAISLGFGAFALAYLAGIVLSLRWFLHWLLGA